MWDAMTLMSPFFRDEILPVILFFGMFFLIYGVGVPLFRKMPHRKGSRLAEMLNDDWEDEESAEEQAKARENAHDDDNGSGDD